MHRNLPLMLACTVFAGAVQAQEFPHKLLRLIVPYAAGGGPDIQARQVAPRLAETIGQAVVVENRVGAAGVLAAQVVAASPADGYTLLLGSNTHLIQKHLQPSLKFDPIAEFAPVGNMIAGPTMLVVSSESPARTAQELVASAAGRPGRMNYASGGIGTSAHLAGATLVAHAKLDAVHIPMRGSVEIAAALLRGDVQFAFPIAGTAIPNVRSGKLRALAVTSPARLPQFPDVPTMAEIMHNDIFVQESWFGAWAPAGTPQPVLQKLHAALAKAMQGPGLRQLLEASGSYAATSKSPGEYAAYVKSEHAKWGEIVKLSGAKAE